MTGRSWWRALLNLPEPTAKPVLPSETAKMDEVPRAAAQLPVGYTAVHTDQRVSYARRVGRIVLWVLVGLLLLLGLRTLVRPTTRVIPPAAVATYPDGEASGVAARFVQAYLTNVPTNREAVDERAKVLALDTAEGISIETTWAGTQATSVAQVIPAGVTPAADGKTATVRVLALLRTTAAQHAVTSRWVGVSVPVQRTSTRVAVAGTPAFVAIPAPGPADRPKSPTTDSDVTKQTREGVAAFFAAYAGADAAALQQVAAPGSQLLPLGGLTTLQDMTSWQVDAGDAERRTGHASVNWRLGASTVTQHYRVELISVSGGGTQSWRVNDVAPEVLP